MATTASTALYATIAPLLARAQAIVTEAQAALAAAKAATGAARQTELDKITALAAEYATNFATAQAAWNLSVAQQHTPNAEKFAMWEFASPSSATDSGKALKVAIDKVVQDAADLANNVDPNAGIAERDLTLSNAAEAARLQGLIRTAAQFIQNESIKSNFDKAAILARYAEIQANLPLMQAAVTAAQDANTACQASGGAAAVLKAAADAFAALASKVNIANNDLQNSTSTINRLGIMPKNGQAEHDAVQALYDDIMGDKAKAHSEAQTAASEYDKFLHPGYVTGAHDIAEAAAKRAEALRDGLAAKITAIEAAQATFLAVANYDPTLKSEVDTWVSKAKNAEVPITADAKAARDTMNLWDGITSPGGPVDDGVKHRDDAVAAAATVRTRAATIHLDAIKITDEYDKGHAAWNLANAQALLAEIENLYQLLHAQAGIAHDADNACAASQGTIAVKDAAHKAALAADTDENNARQDLNAARAALQKMNGYVVVTPPDTTEPPPVVTPPVVTPPVNNPYLQQRDALIAQAASGVTEVEARNLDAMQRTKMASPLELLKAANELERRANDAAGRPKTLYASTGKGIR